MKYSHAWQRYIRSALVLLVLTVGASYPAFAQTPASPTPPASPAPAAPAAAAPASPTPAAAASGTNDSDVCTDFAGSKERIFGGSNGAGGDGATGGNGANGANGDNTKEEPGLLSEIYLYIKEIVDHATEKLFHAFTNSDAYQQAVGGAIVLMMVIFGAAFTMGVAQASFGQILIRLVKLGIIFTLISPDGWDFFNGTVAKFFTDGTDELVKGVIAIGTGVQPPPDATPFYQFDKLAAFIIQPDTIVAILGGLFSGGPFGSMMGALMIISTWGFIMLLLRALQQYAVSFVARTLMLGLAPIFFVFLLFEKTKSLFINWLNALITLALKPILLFTFLSFFLVLIETAAKDMFSAELCWSQVPAGEGMSNKPSFWRFVDPETGRTMNSSMTWNGSVECLASGRGNCPEFPVNILDVLSFLILVYLATRFANSIENIANELGNAFVSLDTAGKLDQFVRQQGLSGGGILGGGNTPSGGAPRGNRTPSSSAQQTGRNSPPGG